MSTPESQALLKSHRFPQHETYGKPLVDEPSHATAQSPVPSSGQSTVRAGLAVMLISALCQAFMGTLAHAATVKLNFTATALLLVRAPVSLTAAISFLISSGNLGAFARVPRNTLPFLALRGVGGALNAFFQYCALARIGVGKAMTLFYVGPMLVSLGAAVFFREPFTLAHVAMFAANFGGIAMVSQHVASGADSVAAVSKRQNLEGVAFALGSAVASSVAALCIKAMNGVHSVVITSAHGSVCIILALIFRQAGDLHILATNKAGLFCAVFSALSAFMAQTLMAVGLKRAPAGPAMVIRTINVPFVFAIGFFFMGETVGLVNIIGACLVVGSVICMGLYTARLKNQRIQQR